MKRNSGLVQLLLIYAFWVGASILGGSLTNLYFKDAGVNDTELIISYLLWSIAPLFVIAFMNGRRTDFRTLMLISLGIQAGIHLAVASFEPTVGLFLAWSFLSGTTIFFFWVPFNTAYFEKSAGKEALLGSVYFAIWPLMSLVLPSASGWIAESIGFNMLFIAAAAVYVIALVPAFLTMEKRPYVHSLEAFWGELKGFRSIILLEGIYGGGIIAATAVVTLRYFTTPLELGIFLSVTTIFAIIASLLTGRLSDMSRKRKVYINIFGGAVAGTTALLALARTTMAWYGIVSAYNFFRTLLNPFTTAIIADTKRDMLKVMVGREVMLNIGRICGVLMVLCFSFWDLHSSFVPLSLVIAAYPLLVEFKKKHINVE